MSRRVLTLGACAALAVCAVLTGTQAEASARSRPDSQSRPAAWQPEAADYGVSQAVTIPVTMNDGVVISTEVVYPTIPATGALAPGKFPVLLTQNPYGDPAAALQAGTYYVQRGYIYVVSAIRGTGASGGQLSWFGKRQGEDGAELVSWAARDLAGSDGKVGLDGCSYLGVDQCLLAVTGRAEPHAEDRRQRHSGPD